VLTLPLSVYYFHVVPLGFVFANLIVMLLIMPIMYVGLVVLLLGKWLPVLGYILGWLINVLITSVQFIEHIPHVTLSNISVYAWQVVLMYVLLWLLVKYSRRAMGLAFSMVAVAVLMVSFLLASTSSKEQCEMVLFNINQHTALQVVEGKQAYLVADAGLLADSTTLQYNLEEYNIAKHIKRTTTYELGSSTPYKYGGLYANANVVQYNKTRFLFVGHADVYDKAATLPLQVDYVVLTNNTRADVAALAKCVTAKQWVLDRSNSNYYLHKFESICDSLHLPYYSMRTRKALVVQP
ncbi:MAG: ComEC/Rec2 family competence protein, partial [Bacteroidales bacterium]|nr:ComEC/Rec2 family competence protein [Bacteroidales bacterium]